VDIRASFNTLDVRGSLRRAGVRYTEGATDASPVHISKRTDVSGAWTNIHTNILHNTARRTTIRRPLPLARGLYRFYYDVVRLLFRLQGYNNNDNNSNVRTRMRRINGGTDGRGEEGRGRRYFNELSMCVCVCVCVYTLLL